MLDTWRKYALKRIELLKIEAIDKVSASAGMTTYITIILVAFVFFTLLCNFGLAFLIGKGLNNYSYGFLIVAAFYLFIIVFTKCVKKSIVNYVANKVILFLNQ